MCRARGQVRAPESVVCQVVPDLAPVAPVPVVAIPARVRRVQELPVAVARARRGALRQAAAAEAEAAAESAWRRMTREA